MIKLIASDIDGTLLVEGSDSLNTEIFDVICKLKDKDIIFAAASGRQYTSIRRLFEPVANDMIFVSDNGASIICRGYEIHASVMDRDIIKELALRIRQLDDCYMVASTRNGQSYIEEYDEGLVELLANGYHVDLHQIEDILKIPYDIIKCSIYKKHDIQMVAPEFQSKYQDRLNVTIAGDIWLDFMNYDVDKGIALKTIQDTLHILPEETMVFGDNMNDIGMMEAAGESYAVANAAEAVKAAAKHLTGKNTEDGVLKVLKKVLETQ